MAVTKALIVFCEGAHDVAFLQRVLKISIGAKEVNQKLSEYPAPFNLLLRSNIDRYIAEDFKLDMARKFFLPDKILQQDEWQFLLFNSGGNKQIDKVKEFLKDFLTMYKGASVFPGEASSIITEVKYLFFYDADHQTPDDVAKWMQNKFKSIDETDWELTTWQIGETERGVIQNDKALYIWAGDDGRGTLENILLPIYRESNPDLLKGSEEFISTTFNWDTKGLSESKKSKIESCKIKATICTAGQGQRPGSPLSAIIQDNILGDKTVIADNTSVQALIDFIRRFIGL